MRSLEILEKLIAFPTVSKDSNLALIDWVEEFLNSKGFTVTRIWSPDRNKAGLFARVGPATEGGVCLSAHTDVVPVEGQNWTRPPFELTRDDNRLYGRGTTDMKGFLASALALAEQAAQSDLAVPLSLSISYDEEIGCVGIRQMMPELKEIIGAPEAVIVGEPTSMQIAIGHKGKAALRATCTGQAGHSALAPDFVNAIHVASEFVGAVRGIQKTLAAGTCDPAYDIPYSTIHIGKISGGKALNIVPEETVIDFECRHLAETPASDIRALVENAAKQVADSFGADAEVRIEEVNAYPGLNTPTDCEIVDRMKMLADTETTTKVAFGTEAGFFTELGFPTIVIGPGDMARDGHKPDEGLDLSQLEACDRFLGRVLTSLVK